MGNGGVTRACAVGLRLRVAHSWSGPGGIPAGRRPEIERRKRTGRNYAWQSPGLHYGWWMRALRGAHHPVSRRRGGESVEVGAT